MGNSGKTKVVAVLALLFLSSNYASAEVKLGRKNFVENRPGGYCVYSSLEMVGRYNHDKRLYGLVDWAVNNGKGGGADSWDTKRCLNHFGVKSYVTEHASLDWLKEMLDAHVPVIIASQVHAVVALDVKDGYIKVADPNEPNYYIWYPVQWWCGWAVMLYPPE